MTKKMYFNAKVLFAYEFMHVYMYYWLFIPANKK